MNLGHAIKQDSGTFQGRSGNFPTSTPVTLIIAKFIQKLRKKPCGELLNSSDVNWDSVLQIKHLDRLVILSFRSGSHTFMHKRPVKFASRLCTGYLQSGLSLVPYLVNLLFFQVLLLQGGRVTLVLGLPQHSHIHQTVLAEICHFNTPKFKTLFCQAR